MSDSKALLALEDRALSDVQRKFCDLVAGTVTIEKACKQLGWTESQYRSMRRELPAFDRAVSLAREIAQDAWVDKLDEIIEKEPDTNRARLKADVIKWRASKLKARVYGDKLDLTIEHRVDLGEALAAARARATLRPMCDLPDVIEGEVVDSPKQSDAGAVDKQSTPALPDIFE